MVLRLMESKELKNKMKEFCGGDDVLYKNCVELFEFGEKFCLSSLGRQNKLKNKLDEMFPEDDDSSPAEKQAETPAEEE